MKRVKKFVGFTVAALLTSTLLTTPVLATSETPFKSLEDFKKQKQVPNAQEIKLLGYNQWGEFEEEEPNNTMAQANHITTEDLAVGTFTKSDKDYYKIEINGDEEVDLSVSLFSMNEDETNMQLNVNVYNSTGEEMDSYFEGSDEYGYGGGFYLDPGVYYFEASDLADLNNGETYMFSPLVLEDEPYIDRIAGEDRYHTAAAIAVRRSAGYPSDHIILATGADFPDALAGAPLAFYYDAPILLTRKNSLPQITKSTIEVLGAKHVTILGGTGAISKDVENSLVKLGLDVERISGADRYETATAIAEVLPASDGAVVAYGRNFPDALSIAPVAASNMMPILLTEKSKLPDATKQAINDYDFTYVVGGEGVIDQKVFSQLPDPERISGKNRYSTSIAIAEYFELEPTFVNIATGVDFADALAGATYTYGEPLLLTPTNYLSPEVKDYFVKNETFYFTILGGTAAVSENVEDEILELFE
ncbi:cell wall-binding repeat-containing protein [Halobacillus sp. GSS1]|uniref:cell wall-binding repeat-containing protein n=1 Tax=Halobacillus sp. GSS1 TaxID=2815919 RepID=UPI001A90B36A|nr:cell wall-binding repeat-containing protein [Halobacillus sp. GSS1]MBN9655043.1 cell wall-binding repeat-containing protein [Halobacillus sp. GSS1]